jgi:acyl-CoA synthetase (AMP-forming)/AMP-acid ligase II
MFKPFLICRHAGRATLRCPSSTHQNNPILFVEDLSICPFGEGLSAHTVVDHCVRHSRQPHHFSHASPASCSHAGATLDEAAVRIFAGQKLASYKVPRRVLFLGESDLPLTGSAKVKTSDLRNLAARTLLAEAAV